jgi:hypothetical protein
MYPPRRKKSKTKIYLAIALVAILVASSAAIVYFTTASNGPKAVTVGVHVGDTFTYSIKSSATLGSLDAVIPSDFYTYNQTDYFKVTVTGIDSTNVSLSTQWHFLNGTDDNRVQTIDLSNGAKSDPYGFWSLYAANLKIKDYIRPNGGDFIIVNDTQPTTYANSVRSTDFFEIGNEFKDYNDPTGNTLRYEYNAVRWDKETGMLTSLNNIQQYNNPQMVLSITWTLMDTSVWTVK